MIQNQEILSRLHVERTGQTASPDFFGGHFALFFLNKLQDKEVSRTLFGVLTEEDFLHLNELVESFMDDPALSKGKEYLLEELLSSESFDFARAWSSLKEAASVKDLMMIRNHVLFAGLLSILLKHPELFPMQTTTLFYLLRSRVKRVMSEQMKAVFQPLEVATDSSISVGCKKWELCDRAEPRLMSAFATQGVVVLTDDHDVPIMIRKHLGRPAAVVLKNFTTLSGDHFFKGMWLIPVSGEGESDLREAFDMARAKVRLSEMRQIQWEAMRVIEPSYLEDGDNINEQKRICRKLSQMEKNEILVWVNKKTEDYGEYHLDIKGKKLSRRQRENYRDEHEV